VAQNSPGTGQVGSIKTVDTATKLVVGTAALNGEPAHTVVVSPDQEYVYALSKNAGTETFYKIRRSDMQILGSVPVTGVRDTGFSLDPVGSKAYLPDPADVVKAVRSVLER